MERYLARYFSSFDNGLPPPGLYHRILREVEYPLLSAALAGTLGLTLVIALYGDRIGRRRLLMAGGAGG